MAQTKTKNGVTYKKSSSGKWFRAGGGNAQGGSRVTPADYVRLGPDVARLKAQTPPKDWAQIVKTAHKQGWTVASALDTGTPAALKQKTQASIRAAAQRQIDDAYKPAYAELEGGESQASGLRQKRLADQAQFDQWAAQEASKVAQSMNAAQTKYEDAIKAGADARIKDAQAVAQGFAGKAGAGGISDLSGSVANADVNRTQQATTERAHVAQDYAAAQRPIVAERAAAIPTAALGSAYQRHAQIEGDFSKALGSINQDRLKLNTARAADQVKAYADLLQTEMDKAASNRDYQGLMMQVKSKEQIAKEDAANYRLGIKAKIRGQDVAANTSVTVAKIGAAEKAADRAAKSTTAALNRANQIQITKLQQEGKSTGPAAAAKSRATVQGLKSLATVITSSRKSKSRTFLGQDSKRHKLTDANLISQLGVSQDQINVARRIANGVHGAKAIHNPAILGILPEHLGFL